MYKRNLKRIIDIILSALGCIILSPLFLVIIIAIKVNSKGSVFFKQKRSGINKSNFIMYKFRTMRVDTPAETPTHLLDDPGYYITNVGKILRKTSLDELPQIINILKGDMSIIGPRPALWNQHDLIEEREKYGANRIRPGLTGLAQINGRDELEITEKAKLDGEYVNQLSFLMDVNCFFCTFVKVFKFSGVVEGGTGKLKKGEENS